MISISKSDRHVFLLLSQRSSSEAKGEEGSTELPQNDHESGRLVDGYSESLYQDEDGENVISSSIFSKGKGSGRCDEEEMRSDRVTRSLARSFL